MRMLFLHCDNFYYSVVSPTKFAEPLEEKCSDCSVRDALVVFITVEKIDASSVYETANLASSEIVRMLKRIGKKEVVLFPFSHLSNDLADPLTAIKIIDEIKSRIHKFGLQAFKAPFGWEKIFSLTCKGHPLAQALRVIHPTNKGDRIESSL
ncbi:MAG: threonyl-tRNA synthetase editing domain-containing protein [Candidatus Methanomethylicaceae archaeon]